MQNTDVIIIPDQIKVENYLRILPIYINELKMSLESIKDVRGTEDFIELASLIHKLKGSAANYGAKKLEKLLGKIQDQEIAKNDYQENDFIELEKTIQLTLTEANFLVVQG